MDAVERCLEILRPHVAVDEMALTGGVALARLGLPRAVGDIDFVARDMRAVQATATRDFLVSHHHVGRKPMVQLVNPETRLRIDVFPDRVGEVARAAYVGAWRVVAASDLLAHKRRLIAAATPAKPVDGKHWRDAVSLAARCGAPPPDRPTYTAATVYATDLGLVCDRCEHSRDAAFPLASKRAIFDVLGYV